MTAIMTVYDIPFQIGTIHMVQGMVNQFAIIRSLDTTVGIQIVAVNTIPGRGTRTERFSD